MKTIPRWRGDFVELVVIARHVGREKETGPFKTRLGSPDGLCNGSESGTDRMISDQIWLSCTGEYTG